MGDDFLNLTPDEAARLGYAPQLLQHAEEFGGDISDSFFVGFFVMVVIAVITILLFNFHRGVESRSEATARPAAAEQRVQTGVAARPEENTGSTRNIPVQPQGQVVSEVPIQDPQYLQGWRYASAGGAIELRYLSNQEYTQVFATIPPGNEFIYLIRESDGCSFVVTLDGEFWGWTRLARPSGPPNVPIIPKFEKAIERLGALEASRDFGGGSIYFNPDWNVEVASAPIPVLNRGMVISVIPQGTEFLQSWRNFQGQSMVMTLDGETSGVACLAPTKPRYTPMEAKLENAHQILKRVDMRQFFGVGDVYCTGGPSGGQ